LVFQYGRGGGTGFGTLARFYYPDFSLNQETSETRWRLVDVLTVQPVDWFSAQAAYVFQRDDLNSPTAGDWQSRGIRVALSPIQIISYLFGDGDWRGAEHLKILGELGNDIVDPKNNSGRRSLTKVTGALALASAGGFWARPELRVFVTYARWNDKALTAHIDSYDLYLGTNKLSGLTAGLQAEAMW
jgi:maltoporin